MAILREAVSGEPVKRLPRATTVGEFDASAEKALIRRYVACGSWLKPHKTCRRTGPF
jgi:hypothetical protein